jgi:hypothetical protein
MVNLPAVNTPQFRWIRNHMPRKAQPFGTIFEPEVAARAIVWASEHPRRELNVGWGTTQAIVTNAFAPGVLDHYLARVSFDGQQGDEPEDPSPPTTSSPPSPATPERTASSPTRPAPPARSCGRTRIAGFSRASPCLLSEGCS